MSYYECVRAMPESSASASRLALTARQLGYSGIIICNRDTARIFMPQAARKIKGIEVIIGAEIGRSADCPPGHSIAAGSFNARALKSRIGSLRQKYHFLMVSGRSDEIMRAASEDPNVDVLMHPCESRRPLTIAAARAARQNYVAIGIDLSPMMQLRGSPRARWLSSLHQTLDLARKFRLSLVITAGAASHLDLRSPRDLLALAEIAGFEPDEAKEALDLPGRIVKDNSRNWLSPGVELL